MARGGFRLVAAVLVAAAFGAGCGSNDETVIILSTPTPAGAVRTATPVRTATVAAPTSTLIVDRTVTPTPAGPVPTATPVAGVDPDVQTAVADLLPFFTVAGLTTGTGSSSASAEEAAHVSDSGIGTATEASTKVDPCPNGGTRTEDQELVSVLITLTACKFTDPQLGSFQFDGTISANLLGASASFDVVTQDLLHNDHTVHFTGTVTGTPASGGGFVVNGGPITIATPQGNFTLNLNNLTVDGKGNVVSGAGTITDTDNNFDLTSITVTIRTGGLLADMHAVFDDNSTADYVIDLKKGTITPA